MNSSSTISVNIDVLRQEAERILIISNRISRIFDDIENINNDLSQQQIWDGKSFDYFDKSFDSITENFENISICLNSTANFLENMAVMYKNRSDLFKK